jgi:pimeloyl-ACP methyl ester carboxylesterase
VSRTLYLTICADEDSIGTTANVRDMVTMADALYGADTDINFYGISYGTYVGMIFTQMFPDRVGKVFLDGVVNPQANAQYNPILGLDEDLGDAAEALRGFYNTCALAGPVQCPLSAQYPTPDAIEGAVNYLLNSAQKIWNDTSHPSYNALIDKILFPSLYNPTDWPGLAQLVELGLSQLANATSLKLDVKRKHKWPYVRPGFGFRPGLDRRQDPQSDQVDNGYYWDGNYTLITVQ